MLAFTGYEAKSAGRFDGISSLLFYLFKQATLRVYAKQSEVVFEHISVCLNATILLFQPLIYCNIYTRCYLNYHYKHAQVCMCVSAGTHIQTHTTSYATDIIEAACKQ